MHIDRLLTPTKWNRQEKSNETVTENNIQAINDTDNRWMTPASIK